MPATLLARAGSSTPRLYRHIHTSPHLAKQQRRQEAFRFNLPPDPTATKERGIEKARMQELTNLRMLEEGRQTATEKYNNNGFGLRPTSTSSSDESGSASAAPDLRALNSNWRAVGQRFAAGEDPLPGLTDRYFAPSGKKGRKDMPSGGTRSYERDHGAPSLARRKNEPDPSLAETTEDAMKRMRMHAERGVKIRWNPKKRLSYAAMAGLKELHVQDPETWPAERLSETFGVSYEAVKRVLRSNYRRESDVPANLMPASAAAARKPKKPDGAHGLGPAFPPPPGTSKWDKSVQPSASASASASTQASTWAPAAVPNTAKWDKANFTGPVGRRFALASPAERVQRTYALKRQVEAEGGAGAGPEQEQELAELKGFREPAERRELAELRDLREPQERRGSWESRGPEARSRRVERPQFERSSFERTHRAREREPRDVNARRRGSSFGLRKD